MNIKVYKKQNTISSEEIAEIMNVLNRYGDNQLVAGITNLLKMVYYNCITGNKHPKAIKHMLGS